MIETTQEAGLLPSSTQLPSESHNGSAADTDGATVILSHQLSYFLLVAELLLMVAILFGNGLVLISIFRFAALRTPTHMFVVALAVSDTCMGLILPFHMASLAQPSVTESFYGCMFVYWSIGLPTASSILFLLGVTIERFVAIRFPFFYQTQLTSRRAGICLTLLGIVALVTSLPVFIAGNRWHPGIECDLVYVFKPEYFLSAFTVPIFTVLLVISVLYADLFRVAIRQHRSIAAAEIPGDAAGGRKSALARLARDTKAARSIGLVIGVYALCFCPMCIVCTVQFTTGSMKGRLQSARFVLTSLTIANSAVNPVIYALRMAPIREAYCMILHPRRRRTRTILVK